MYLGPSPRWGPPPLTTTRSPSRSAALPMGKIYIESRANEWREEWWWLWWWWWRWPVRGGIFCRPDSLCRVHPLQQPSVPRHDNPRILPEPRASLHHPHTHPNTVWVRCVRQSLPYWIARAGTGGERDIRFLTAIRP